jgi:DNA-binding transcriptional LysR family regulator
MVALPQQGGKQTVCRIAILPPIGDLFLPPAIRAFRKRFPVVDLTILESAAARTDCGFDG